MTSLTFKPPQMSGFNRWYSSISFFKGRSLCRTLYDLFFRGGLLKFFKQLEQKKYCFGGEGKPFLEFITQTCEFGHQKKVCQPKFLNTLFCICEGVVISHLQAAKHHTAILSVPLLKRAKGEEAMKKGLWVEIGTGTSLSNYWHRQSGLSVREINVVYCLLITDKSREN